MQEQHAHEFFITYAINSELMYRGINERMKELLNHDIISKIKAPNVRISHPKFRKLGKGERELISVVYGSEDGTYENYIILTFDDLATKVITDLGMKAMNIFGFLKWCNTEGVISKEELRTMVLGLWRRLYPSGHMDPGMVDEFLASQ
ncbi:MAG: hypothetical protein MPI92_01580 [Nitrosopumilus sp.]|nr:hypothetical protein [Nitrosopumilus sp.]